MVFPLHIIGNEHDSDLAIFSGKTDAEIMKNLRIRLYARSNKRTTGITEMPVTHLLLINLTNSYIIINHHRKEEIIWVQLTRETLDPVEEIDSH